MVKKTQVRVLLLFILLLIILPAGCLSQTKTYFLKHSLIFPPDGELPKIYPNNIIFAKNCQNFDHYGSHIIRRGEKVTVTKIEQRKLFAKVSFTFLGEQYEILLSNKSQRTFNSSLSLIFSRKEVEEYNEKAFDRYKTKKDVIQCEGYPITFCKENGIEKLFYIMEFAAGHGSGFDGWWGELTLSI